MTEQATVAPCTPPGGHPAGAEINHRVVFMRDNLTLTTTALAALANLFFAGLTLWVLLPRVDRASIEAAGARREMAEMRKIGLENQRMVRRTQGLLDAQWKEMEAQRETVKRVNSILMIWEHAAKQKAAEKKAKGRGPEGEGCGP